jgi:hypothetical protein
MAVPVLPYPKPGADSARKILEDKEAFHASH